MPACVPARDSNYFLFSWGEKIKWPPGKGSCLRCPWLLNFISSMLSGWDLCFLLRDLTQLDSSAQGNLWSRKKRQESEVGLEKRDEVRDSNWRITYFPVSDSMSLARRSREKQGIWRLFKLPLLFFFVRGKLRQKKSNNPPPHYYAVPGKVPEYAYRKQN